MQDFGGGLDMFLEFKAYSSVLEVKKQSRNKCEMRAFGKLFNFSAAPLSDSSGYPLPTWVAFGRSSGVPVI
jgi:hypothetical protein